MGIKPIAYTLTLVSSNLRSGLSKPSTLQCNLPLEPANVVWPYKMPPERLESPLIGAFLCSSIEEAGRGALRQDGRHDHGVGDVWRLDLTLFAHVLFGLDLELAVAVQVLPWSRKFKHQLS